MKKTIIRRGVFENNSSSQHSLSLAGPDKQFVLDILYPDQDGKIRVKGGEFGWEFVKYNDAETKLNYAYQDDVDRELLERVIKAQTGAEVVIFSNLNDGYIDHESVGTARNICVDDESTRNFIFNKNSWLFTGNDNSQPDPTFYHVPEIRDGKMIYPKYKFELSIDGLTKTTKFLDKPTNEELEQGIDSILEGHLLTEDGQFFGDAKNIHFQINKPRGIFFEKNWMADQDYSKGYVVFTREDFTRDIREELKKAGKLEGLNWHKASAVVFKEILKDKVNSRKVKFTLKEI